MAARGGELRALSPIVPLMYLDSISDGILKGLTSKPFTFRTAVSDSVLGIILILILLRFSTRGIYLDNVFFKRFNLLLKRRQTARNKG